MFIPIVYSLFIIDDMKSSSNSVQVSLCPCVKKSDLARQAAIYIYEKGAPQHIFMLYNFKICSKGPNRAPEAFMGKVKDS